MLFYYKAKTENGEFVDGIMEAEDRFALAREIRSRKQVPISISKRRNQFSNFSALFAKFFGTVKVAELIVFIKNMAGMLHAGLSLSRALSVLQKQTKNEKFAKIINGLADEINSGGSLSSGLSKFPKVFSKLFVSMVRAGEESGTLVQVLHEVESSMEKSHALSKKVRGALIYPGVIFSVMILIGILMFAFVVPTLAKTFKDVGANLPASTQFIVSLGEFFSNNLLLSLVLAAGLVSGSIFLFRAKFMSKPIDFLVLRIPMVGNLARELNTARTARTLSALLSSGVSITRAIEITEDVLQNFYYKKVLKKAAEAVEKGLPMSEVFEEKTNLFPVMMAEMIQVGEETGKLAEMLMEIAVFYEGEVENKTKNLSTVIEPFLMVTIGAAVGFFAVSMISPLYSVMDNIK